MKRLLSIVLILLMLLASLALGETYDSLPLPVRVSYQVDERLVGSKQNRFVSKEYVTTYREDVSDEINALVDAYELSQLPQLQSCDNPRRNSRLDIHVVHSVSSDCTVSFLVLARIAYKRVQKSSPFTTRIYDMTTGKRIYLSDLFPEDSEAWDLLSEKVWETLDHYFPNENCDYDTLSQLCTREALEKAEFMLGPVSMTLHYAADILYPDHTSLMRVLIPYQALEGMLSEYGLRVTDNSHYKMCALTYDDGPDYSTTATILNNLRRGGAQATFFLVGNRIGDYEDIVLRENDENHSLQSHSYKHVDPSTYTKKDLLQQMQAFGDVLGTLTGTQPRMLRPPYGKDQPFINADVGFPLIEWGVDTKDWTGRTPQQILQTVKKEVTEGSVILMHDIKENTPQATKVVLEYLAENGFLCVTVEELAMHYNRELLPNTSYYWLGPKASELIEE